MRYRISIINLLLKIVNYILPNVKYNLQSIVFVIMLYVFIRTAITNTPVINNYLRKISKDLKNNIIISIIRCFLELFTFIILLLQGILCFFCLISGFTVLMITPLSSPIHLFFQISSYQWILYVLLLFVNNVLFKENNYKEAIFCLAFFIVLYIN